MLSQLNQTVLKTETEPGKKLSLLAWWKEIALIKIDFSFRQKDACIWLIHKKKYAAAAGGVLMTMTLLSCQF